MSAPKSKLKVLISGAGIAGPCLAYWLSRTRLDLSITVIERSPTPRVTGQSIDIRGSAIEVIRRMKLEEAIRACNTTEVGTRFINSTGKCFAEFEGGDSFTSEYEILRADLCGVFMDATNRLRNVKYHYGDFIESLDQTDKEINVTFNSGPKNTFDLVVAADGGTSRTRPMILDEITLKDSYNFIGQYIAYFSIPSRPTDTKHWLWYSTPKGLCIMTRPHRNPATIGVYLAITTPKREVRYQDVEDALDKGTAESKRILHKYFKDAGWQAERVLEGMDQCEDFYMSRAAFVKLPKWTCGRALVLGDAAHATFGIGTSLAIESSYYLAGELSKIQGSEDIPAALKRYEEIYRPVYAKSEELPPGYPQMAMPQTVWGLRLRDSLLWFVTKSKLYKLTKGGDTRVKRELPDYDWVDI